MSTFLPQDSNDNPIPVLGLKPSGAHEIAATTSGSARNATPLDAATRVVSLYTEEAVYVRFGDATASASATDHYFPAGVYYDFALGGDTTAHNTHIAVRAVSASGNVYISEKR